MNFPKKLLFLLLSAFLAYRSYFLLRNLYFMDHELSGLLGLFLIAFLLNVYVTGVFAFPDFVFPTHKLIGSSYFRFKNPLMLKRLYDKLGVEEFRKLLMKFFGGKEKNRKKYFDETRSGFDNFIYQSKQSEIGNLLPLIVLTIVSIGMLAKGFILLGSLTLLINFIGNFYPILLQRFHRIRIEKIMRRYAK